VVVDFSAGPATRAAARACAAHGAGLVSGTTGLDRETEDAACARPPTRHFAVCAGTNFSLGVAALRGRWRRKPLHGASRTWDIRDRRRRHRARPTAPRARRAAVGRRRPRGGWTRRSAPLRARGPGGEPAGRRAACTRWGERGSAITPSCSRARGSGSSSATWHRTARHSHTARSRPRDI
jgi:hypothetical protein